MAAARKRRESLAGVHWGLAAFFVVSFARPEDWIPSLSALPLAKIAAGLAFLPFLFALRGIRWPLPREAVYLIALVVQLFATVPMSPVWALGALQRTLEFSKVALIFIVIVSVLDTQRLLRRLMFIQVASVVAIAAVSIWSGHFKNDRLEGVIRGDYADPNSLALLIVTSLPMCLGLLFLSGSAWRKAAWAVAILLLSYAVFLTGSRGGFIALVAAAGVSLWEFAIRGNRRYLLAIVALAGVIFWQLSSGILSGRLQGTFHSSEANQSAYDSAQAREQLLWRSLEVTAEHPLFGVGPSNFAIVSGMWHATHNSFTEMSSEGGLPAFVLYVLILWSGFKNVEAIKRFARGQRGPRLMAQALHASLWGYVVGAFFISTSYDLFPYFLVAYTTALAWIARNAALRPREAASAIPASTGEEAYATG